MACHSVFISSSSLFVFVGNRICHAFCDDKFLFAAVLDVQTMNNSHMNIILGEYGLRSNGFDVNRRCVFPLAYHVFLLHFPAHIMLPTPRYTKVFLTLTREIAKLPIHTGF